MIPKIDNGRTAIVRLTGKQPPYAYQVSVDEFTGDGLAVKLTCLASIDPAFCCGESAWFAASDVQPLTIFPQVAAPASHGFAGIRTLIGLAAVALAVTLAGCMSVSRGDFTVRSFGTDLTGKLSWVKAADGSEAFSFDGTKNATTSTHVLGNVAMAAIGALAGSAAGPGGTATGAAAGAGIGGSAAELWQSFQDWLKTRGNGGSTATNATGQVTTSPATVETPAGALAPIRLPHGAWQEMDPAQHHEVPGMQFDGVVFKAYQGDPPNNDSCVVERIKAAGGIHVRAGYATADDVRLPNGQILSLFEWSVGGADGAIDTSNPSAAATVGGVARYHCFAGK